MSHKKNLDLRAGHDRAKHQKLVTNSVQEDERSNAKILIFPPFHQKKQVPLNNLLQELDLSQIVKTMIPNDGDHLQLLHLIDLFRKVISIF